jgi:DNA-binding transcriptional LysR family regulator
LKRLFEICIINMIDDEGVAMHLLDIDQLRTFVAIADTGSFTRAAEIVHKTQSAVSMQMKRLEDRVGKAIFERDGRLSKLTDEGERLLDYARRIVRLNTECMASFNEHELTGRVRLGLPDDYADRYLPEILARFSRSNPKAEVTVMCEPSHNLIERVQHGDLDLAIITHVDRRGPSEIVRIEQLLWVTSARHGVHEESPVPLALGRPNCDWRHSATEALESADRTFRVAYVSYHSTAVGAAVPRGLGAARERGASRHADPRPHGRLPGSALVQDRPDPRPRRGEPARRRLGLSHQAVARQSRLDAHDGAARGRIDDAHLAAGRRSTSTLPASASTTPTTASGVHT